MILGLFLLALAAICNAVMDTLKDHFGVSIFKNLNPNFWNPQESWNKGINFFGSWGGFRWVSGDAWHLFKFAMLFLIAGAMVAFTATSFYWVIMIPFVWGIFFELFYSFLLKST